MALQTTQGTGYSPQDAFDAVRNQAFSIKAAAQGALASLQTTNVTVSWVFNFVDQARTFIGYLNIFIAVPGVDAFATAQGYTGSLVSDMTSCKNAAQVCIDWVVTNFPKDAQNYIQAYTLNSDGSRNERTFTPAQTAGLQTALTSFIATIS